jgi:hypothetical protein
MKVSCLHTAGSVLFNAEENEYQLRFVSQGQRHFKWFPPPEASLIITPRSILCGNSSVPEWCAFRVRPGHGGTLRVDRPTTCSHPPLVSHHRTVSRRVTLSAQQTP